ncbi:glutathione S-transferase N-terminal domain-containing protein [Haladaptatus halobius]|jgi:glutathione S-transferase|uniref:glutathione S-transferase N-terminal domain-containing protein n=1 Tax=Haladaptatus halobius TaxID=2884875 RepID=UPI001D09A510|nr:glutathione S-transferase N-terminal domain-containing protein [Haladaptatus halobius]
MLELYQAEDCPYSQNVRQAMQDLGLSYVVHNPRSHEGDVNNEQAQSELEAVGGDDQIPFLVDTRREVSMYESDDIVDYLREHYD